MSDTGSAVGALDPAGCESGDNSPDSLRRDGTSTSMVPVGPARTHARGQSSAERGSATTFVAHMLGQGGRQRGLKGGAPVLDVAKTTYLETEWSGGCDRRLPAGKLTKTDV